MASNGSDLAFVQYKGFEGYNPATDTGALTEGGLFVFNVESGGIERVYEYQLIDPANRMSYFHLLEGGLASDFYTGLSPVADELLWLPGGRTLLYSAQGVVSSVSLDNGAVNNLFDQFNNDASSLALSSAARLLLFNSGLQANDENSLCFDASPGHDKDHWVF